MTTSVTSSFECRELNLNDVSQLLELFKDYTNYENLTTEVLDYNYIKSNAFGEDKCFECYVAATPNMQRPLHNGRSAFLQAIYVRPEYRNASVGSQLIKKIAKEIWEMGCVRMDCNVNVNNAIAIKFLKKFGITDLTEKEEWHIYSLDKNALQKMAEKLNS